MSNPRNLQFGWYSCPNKTAKMSMYYSHVSNLMIAEREARQLILQCGVEIWASVCMYVCVISVTLRNAIIVALCINYMWAPPRVHYAQHVLTRLSLYSWNGCMEDAESELEGDCAWHLRSRRVQRHRANAIEMQR